MESALCPKDPADFKFPGQLHEPVDQKRVIQSQVRRATVEICSVVEFPGLWHRVAIARNEACICIRVPGRGILDQRWNPNEAVCGPSPSEDSCAQTSLYVTHKTRAQSVINGVGPVVESLHREAPAHALADTNADTVEPSLVPRTIAEDWPCAGAGLQLAGMAWYAGFKSQIRRPDTKHVAYVAMVVISLNHDLLRNLSLHAEMKRTGVRCLEARVNGNRNQKNSRNRKVHGEVAKASPEEKPRLLADCGTGCIRELLRIKARQGLHVVQAHYGVGRDRGMARC